MTIPMNARSGDMMATVRLWALDGPHAGQSVDRGPVDAREMLARGGWSLTPPDAAPVTTLQPAEAPVAVPLAVTNSFDAEPGKPMTLPKGRAAARGR